MLSFLYEISGTCEKQKGFSVVVDQVRKGRKCNNF